ncbi:G-protein-coupled receptor [Tieghemostelium lacteum]|uniref:G-protein-coupled receptor n=1 Tax=Tieghemostelium lacteum TaxID=361077 RepID=A0A152A5N5_TIELA|nr:G-protein-coupled receptor [Tieghemostelium lacteum]|eukprot:KYR01539.1 G-protein-coupled receptor [Tieghemostelium lacteum]
MLFCRRLELSGITFINGIEFKMPNMQETFPMHNFITSIDIGDVNQTFLESFPLLKNVNLMVKYEDEFGVALLDLNKLVLEKGINLNIIIHSSTLYPILFECKLNSLEFYDFDQKRLIEYLNKDTTQIDCANVTIDVPYFPTNPFLHKCISLKSLSISVYGRFSSVIDTLKNTKSSQTLESFYMSTDGTLNIQSLDTILSDNNFPNLNSYYLCYQKFDATYDNDNDSDSDNDNENDNDNDNNNNIIQSKLHFKKLSIVIIFMEGELNIFNYLSMVKVDELELSDKFFKSSITLPFSSKLLDNVKSLIIPSNLETLYPELASQIVQLPSLTTISLSNRYSLEIITQSLKSKHHLQTLSIDTIFISNIIKLLQVTNEIESIHKIIFKTIVFESRNDPNLEQINTVIKLVSEAQWLKEFSILKSPNSDFYD